MSRSTLLLSESLSTETVTFLSFFATTVVKSLASILAVALISAEPIEDAEVSVDFMLEIELDKDESMFGFAVEEFDEDVLDEVGDELDEDIIDG
jgi:hypothetical protein